MGIGNCNKMTGMVLVFKACLVRLIISGSLWDCTIARAPLANAEFDSHQVGRSHCRVLRRIGPKVREASPDTGRKSGSIFEAGKRSLNQIVGIYF